MNCRFVFIKTSYILTTLKHTTVNHCSCCPFAYLQVLAPLRCSVRLYSHFFCRGGHVLFNFVFIYVMFYLILYLFTSTCVQHDFHISCCTTSLTLTRRVPQVEQKLPTLPVHWSPLLFFVGFVLPDL
jgi:hypothetical protein